ncbi:hypothetical protein EYF80_023683 [Liparis tanakae]|uniref:Uncharacterized protein n=1 Tax=Liparis tanakae TaxID=230148 RepID=A0A4Z2HL75_9TELE|nr:hypothetical protein EYF80_023683 [Liparis tanakae]
MANGAACTCSTVLVKVHGDGEVEVLRAEGSVGVVRLSRGHIRNVLRTAEHHGVVVVGIAMAKPLEVKSHTQVGQLMKIGLIDVHDPAPMQKETTFVPPGQQRGGVNCGLGQQVNRLANQSPGRVPARPPHDGVQRDVRCVKRIFSEG